MNKVNESGAFRITKSADDFYAAASAAGILKSDIDRLDAFRDSYLESTMTEFSNSVIEDINTEGSSVSYTLDANLGNMRFMAETTHDDESSDWSTRLFTEPDLPVGVIDEDHALLHYLNELELASDYDDDDDD